MDAGRTLPEVHAIVLAAYLGVQASFETVLEREFPAASPEARSRVAYAVFALAFGNTLMTDIQFSAQRIADARSVAEEVIAHLTATAA
jgi:hypothetical protein